MSEPGLERLQRQVSELQDRVLSLESQVRDLLRLRHGAESSAPSIPSFDLVSSEVSFSVLSENAREVLAGQFPECPSVAFELCASLRRGQLPKEERARRAWVAGCWAKLVLEDKIRLPEPAAPIGLSNTCYVILRAAGHRTPKLVEDVTTYQEICQGPSCRPVGHGFASKSEAKVYCLAADVEFPKKVFKWSSTQ